MKVVLKHRLFYHFCLIYDGRYWTVSKFLCEMFILCTWIPTTFKYISFLFFQFLLFSVCIISFCYLVLCMVLFQLSSKFGFIISSKWYLNLFSKKKFTMKVVKKYPSSFFIDVTMTAEFNLYYLSVRGPFDFLFHAPLSSLHRSSGSKISLSLSLSIYLSISISEIVIGLLEIKKIQITSVGNLVLVDFTSIFYI